MRFGSKLALLFWVCTMGISLLTIGFFYRESTAALHKEAGTKLARSAFLASGLINPLAHSKIKSADDSRGPQYRELAEKMQIFLAANPSIHRIYTLVPSLKRDKLRVIMDMGQKGSNSADVGTLWKIPQSSKVMYGFSCAVFDPRVRADGNGTWISGYAPVKNADGKAIALVGLDMSASEVAAAQQSIQTSTCLALLSALALATTLSLLLSSTVSRSINRITDATERLAEGNLDCSIPVNGSDELGTIATSLNDMAANLKERQANMLRRANTDGLTGLYNHRYFHDRLGQEMKRSLRYNRPLALLMIDLDGFKAVNDNLGHTAGDAVLKNFAATLAGAIREIDLVARYGGDEFAVIMPETSAEEALGMAERIRAVVDSHSEMSGETVMGEDARPGMANTWKVSLSIGVAECPANARDGEALVSAADIAMYHAKHISHNAVSSYTDVPGAGSNMDPCRVYSFLRNASVGAIVTLAKAVDAKDQYAHGHSESVARYSVGTALEMGISEEDSFNIKIAALLHDVGKIGMPEEVLSNPGLYTEHEREIMQTHSTIGERIVSQVPQLEKVLPAILYHHERFDGTGYPCGLVGDRIPLAARIVCVADAFDAMTSDRPYRDAMTMGQAVHELNEHAGTQFDPACVKALLRWIQAEQLQAA